MTRTLRVYASAMTAALLLMSGVASAQTLYGSVLGVVADASKSAVPGATVSVRSSATGLELTTVTGETGTYSVTNVLPGTYDVTVTLQGFRETRRTSVPVSAGTVVRVDVTLEVGDLTESVTVASEVALLQTDKSDTRVELRSRDIVDMPLPAYRNFQSLMNLVPGATPPVGANTNDTPGKSLRSVVNGTNSNNNGTKLDGQVNINVWLTHHLAYVPPAETIDSVNISTSSFDADQGMAGGAAVTVVTKSGTNDVRGSAFGFYGADELNARAYFSPSKPDSSRLITGGTVGGPVLKNRLFYFGSWEGMFERDTTFSFFDVPTARMRAGDFSEVSAVIYDPATGAVNGAGRQPFAANAIPAGRLSQAALRLQEFYPMPNLPGLTRNYVQDFESDLDRNNYDVKMNWNRSTAHQLWGKLSVMDALSQNLARFGFDGKGRGDTSSVLMSLGQTYTLNSATVLDGTVGYNRYVQDFRPPDFGVNYGLDLLGIPGTNGSDPRESGFPWFSTGLATIGEGRSWYPMERRDGSASASANLTMLRGTHEFRMGGEVARLWLNHWQPEVGAGPRGGFTFGGGPTALRGGAAPNIYNRYAAFLLGLPTQVGKSVQNELMTGREWQFGLYVRDRWQVTPKVTVNAGVRWEYYPLMTRKDRGIELLDLQTLDVLLGGVGNTPTDLGIGASKRLFAPRLGLAWRWNDDTVFRTGYGLTYNPQPFSRPFRGFYPLTIASDFASTDAFVPFGRLEDGIPDIATPDTSTGRIPLPSTVLMRSPDPNNIDRGYVQSWNVAVERRLPVDFAVSTAYVGTRTSRGFAYQDINAGVPGQGIAGQPYFQQFGHRTAIQWFGGITRSNYHSLQVAINRPFKQGLMLKGAYTLSKAMNMTDDDGWAGLAWNSPEVLDRNYALAGFDRPHVFQMGFVYELPFARGRSGLLPALTRNWQVNGIFARYSGTPFTVTSAGTSLNAPGNMQTADQVGTVERPGGIGPDAPYFDPSAWAAVTQVRYGTSGRNSVRGPGATRLDLSVFRAFQIGRLKPEVRIEAFNLTNTPQFGNPASNVTGANFMRILSASNERNIRVGLRLAF